VKIVKNMNQGVIQVRKDICHDCPIPCDKQEKIDFISYPHDGIQRKKSDTE
jgi:hypothetical protein